MTEKKSKFSAAKAKVKRLWDVVIKRDGATSLKQRIDRESIRKAGDDGRDYM